MKSAVLLLLLFVSISSLATDEKYVEAMKKNIKALYDAPGNAELQNTINSLQRVSNVEKEKWEPHYYISLGYIFMATREEDGAKKDSFLDLAKDALTKANELKKDDSEIAALEGFIHMIRLTVDPATRGAQYSNLAANSFEKAIALNPNNPRAMALMAQIQYGTLQFFKRPTTEACDRAKKALTLFGSEQPENPLAPIWGKGMTEDLLKKCE